MPGGERVTVPFLDLKRQYAAIRGEVEAAVARVLESQRFILGPEGEALEQECAAFLGVPVTVGVASGTDALLLAWRALGLGAGDEVVTSAFSFFASAGAVANAGARPVFADIDPVTFTLDPRSAAAAAGARTRAVCPVHLFGQAADIDALRDLLPPPTVPIIEDACQAIGARLGGARAGSLGEAAAFSFFPTKNLGGAGDGGLVAGRNVDLAARLRLLRHHGQAGSYRHELIGTNSRLDEIQAAILRVKLPHLPAWTEARRSNAAALSERFSASSLAVREGGILDGADLSLPAEAPGRLHVYNQYTLRARDRDGLVSHLRNHGIGCAVYYPLPLHLQPCFRSLGYVEGEFPATEAACREVLSLPVFPGLTEEELERVVAVVVSFYDRPGGSR